MALIAPIAKGTAQTKVSGTTLSPSAFSMDVAFSLLISAVTYKSSVIAGSFVVGEEYTILVPGTTNFTLIGAADSLAGTEFTATGVGTGTGTAMEHPQSVKFGSRSLRLVANTRTSELNSGITTAQYRAIIEKTNSRTLTYTWASSLSARACFASDYGKAGPRDVGKGNAQASTTNPTTGIALTTTEADTIHCCAFGSNGPVEDASGTIQVGHITGQRDGTTGGVAATNVTIHETNEILTATGDCRAAKISTTARRWANCITAFSGNTYNEQGLVPGEFQLVAEKFESVSKNFGDAVFHFNIDSDTWEVFEIDTAAETAVSNARDGWDV